MTAVGLPQIVKGVRNHYALWVSDYLGAWEIRNGIDVGATKRPLYWYRIEEWPPAQVTEHAVYVTVRGIDPESLHEVGDEWWGEVWVELIVTCPPTGSTSYEAGTVAYLYQQATLELFRQQRVMADFPDFRIVDVRDPGVTEQMRVGSAVFNTANVTVVVDAPIVDDEPIFNSPPSGPGLPPRDPDVPVVALTVETNVETKA